MQPSVAGDHALAPEFSRIGKLIELPAETLLTVQGDADSK